MFPPRSRSRVGMLPGASKPRGQRFSPRRSLSGVRSPVSSPDAALHSARVSPCGGIRFARGEGIGAKTKGATKVVMVHPDGKFVEDEIKLRGSHGRTPENCSTTNIDYQTLRLLDTVLARIPGRDLTRQHMSAQELPIRWKASATPHEDAVDLRRAQGPPEQFVPPATPRLLACYLHPLSKLYQRRPLSPKSLCLAALGTALRSNRVGLPPRSTPAQERPRSGGPASPQKSRATG